MDGMLRGFWYLALLGSKVGRGRTVPVTLLGEPVLLGRRADGGVFAFGDSCPHRGMPMRHGGFDGATLRCCFHGWAFSAADGRCTEIPSAAPGDDVDPGRFRLRAFPCREVQGNLWVFMPAGRTLPDPLPDVPAVPGFDGQPPRVATTMRFPCPVDLAASGFFDPGHPAFVHTSRWWKAKPSERLRLKEKRFEPDGMGFRMARHAVRGGGLPYKLLGRNVHAEIRVQLPGLRIEHIEGTRNAAAVLAAATPVSERETDVHYCVYWTLPWLAPLKPLAAWMARDFLGQDRDVAVQMMGNPALPAQLFVGDADAQIRWFLRLKKEALASAAENRPFTNPLRAQTLRWRS